MRYLKYFQRIAFGWCIVFFFFITVSYLHWCLLVQNWCSGVRIYPIIFLIHCSHFFPHFPALQRFKCIEEMSKKRMNWVSDQSFLACITYHNSKYPTILNSAPQRWKKIVTRQGKSSAGTYKSPVISSS